MTNQGFGKPLDGYRRPSGWRCSFIAIHHELIYTSGLNDSTG
jgi:hypothetical protein